eukprot:8495741-Alexandrium_andersonii.AAC.1
MATAARWPTISCCKMRSMPTVARCSLASCARLGRAPTWRPATGWRWAGEPMQVLLGGTSWPWPASMAALAQSGR